MPGTYVDRFFTIIEKALIPVAVALIAFFGNRAAQSLSAAQLELSKQTARDNADARRQEFDQQMQAKYLEMFHADLASGEKQRQSTAIQLLYLMEPQLAESVSKSIANNPDASPELRDKVEVAARKIEASTLLPQFKIGIYYPLDDEKAKSTAESIGKSLSGRRVGKEVALYPRSRQTLDNWGTASSLEVRYEEGTEDTAADQLVGALAEAPLQLTAGKLTVGTRTPGFVSIMVPTGG